MTYKVENNIVYWHNGQKWLIKETCINNAAALALEAELEARDE